MVSVYSSTLSRSSKNPATIRLCASSVTVGEHPFDDREHCGEILGPPGGEAPNEVPDQMGDVDVLTIIRVNRGAFNGAGEGGDCAAQEWQHIQVFDAVVGHGRDPKGNALVVRPLGLCGVYIPKPRPANC